MNIETISFLSENGEEVFIELRCEDSMPMIEIGCGSIGFSIGVDQNFTTDTVRKISKSLENMANDIDNIILKRNERK